jgi:phytol kinase
MGIVSFIATALPLAASSSLSAGMILLSSFFVGTVAMVVEALTPWGLDNITVPFAVLLVLRLFL